MGMKAIIIGGGIGGLSTALSFKQAGIEARVFESVKDPSAVGAGINLQPNAVRELFEMGLGDALTATGVATHQWSVFNKHGQLIWRCKCAHRPSPRLLRAGRHGRDRALR